MRTFEKRPHPPCPPGLLVSQAAGMRWLAEGPLRVPEVVSVSDDELVMELVEPGPRAADFDERLGRGLAGLHALGAERFGAMRTFIGPLEVPEPACEAWPAYYGCARLEPVLRMAALPDPAPVEARATGTASRPHPSSKKRKRKRRG